MARIREEVSITAPAAEVWKTVHVDLESVPRWAGYVARAEQLDGGTPGPGSRVRYDLALPGGFRGSLVLEYTTWDPPRRCAGRFVEGPMQGTWSYAYTQRNGTTDLVYEMDHQLTGLLRFAGRLLQGQYEEGIREAMVRLKQYIET
jgi:uncharacterized protein YndB with AHSA1/START domain